MDPVPMHGDLQIDQDLDFSRREWRIQRVGWLVMLLFIVAASVGLLGAGPLSAGSARTADGRLGIEHHRVARHSAPDLLRFDIAPEAAVNGTVRLWLDRTYVQGRTIKVIAPEPERSSVSANRIIYEFRIGDPSSRTIIAFRTEPDDMWRQKGAAGLVGGDSLRFGQIVLP